MVLLSNDLYVYFIALVMMCYCEFARCYVIVCTSCVLLVLYVVCACTYCAVIRTYLCDC